LKQHISGILVPPVAGSSASECSLGLTREFIDRPNAFSWPYELIHEGRCVFSSQVRNVPSFFSFFFLSLSLSLFFFFLDFQKFLYVFYEVLVPSNT
jgi:hypothetical protein